MCSVRVTLRVAVVLLRLLLRFQGVGRIYVSRPQSNSIERRHHRSAFPVVRRLHARCGDAGRCYDFEGSGAQDVYRRSAVHSYHSRVHEEVAHRFITTHGSPCNRDSGERAVHRKPAGRTQLSQTRDTQKLPTVSLSVITVTLYPFIAALGGTVIHCLRVLLSLLGVSRLERPCQ